MMKKLIPIVIFFSTLTAFGQTLHYIRPAQYFEEALVIGNGTMGGTIYGGVETDRISLNDITFWTGEPDSDYHNPSTSAAALRAIREALRKEDYRAADSLQRYLQGHYSENYQPIGNLLIHHLDVSPNVDHYQRTLDLADATALTQFYQQGSKYATRYFCSHPDQVMVVSVRSHSPIRLALEFQQTELPHHDTLIGSEYIIDGYAAYHSLPHYLSDKQKFWYDPDRGIHYRLIVTPLDNHTRFSQHDSQVLAEGGKEITLLIAVATSFNGFQSDPVDNGKDYKSLVAQRINSAKKLTYQQLLKRHTDDYQHYYKRVELELGRTARTIAKLPTDIQLRRYTELQEHNPDLEETYFQYGRYLLIACSRTPGVPANLQGLWNEQVLPPWSSNYTCNINLSENYWMAEVANLSEMHLPLLSFLSQTSINGARTAQQLYGINEGWCLAHNSDIWAMTNPVGLGSGDPVWANWNMGGSWLISHLWEHYLYSRDSLFLKQNYPILKGAAQFCMGWVDTALGYLMPMPSTSPENRYITSQGYHGATLYGATADVAMIRECLQDALWASRELGVSAADPFIHQCQQTLALLPPYQIGHKGNLQEWYHDWEDAEPTHRHQSHLYGLYPGHQFDADRYDDPSVRQQWLDACQTSLSLRGDESTGWSTGWRINLYARMGKGEEAYYMYRKLLRYISPDGYQGADAIRGGGTYPNLLDAHSPFQIDGNFGGCAGVCEMLLQSSPNQITLLPALPEAWKKGHVCGLRTRRGTTVDIRWRKGKIVKWREY